MRPVPPSGPTPARLVAASILAGAAIATLAGCASRATMDARYEASLARWKGAPRDLLVAAWGTPNLEEALDDGGALLVYVVHHDMENRPRQPMPTVVTDARGRTTVVMTPAMTAAPVVPITCTTRFALRGGVVESWSFEGLACGAPE